MTLRDAAPRRQQAIALPWKLFAFMVAAALGMFLAGLGSKLLQPVVRIKSDQLQPALMAGAVLLISALFLRIFEGLRLAAIGVGFDRRWIRQSLFGAALGVVLVGVAWGGMVAMGIASWQFNDRLLARAPSLAIAALFSAAVAANEEVVCRGYAFQILYQWNRALGIALGGLFFVLIHVTSPGGANPVVALNMLLAHLVYVILFSRTRSLWPCFGLHMAWNFTLAFVLGMPLSGMSTSATILRTRIEPSLWGGQAFGPEAGLMITVALAAATLALWRLLPARRPRPSLVDMTPESPASAAQSSEGATPAASTRGAGDETPRLALAPQSNRLAALDMLRAVALFGILPMNIQGFAMHDSAVLNPYSCEWTDSLNVGVWVASTALFGRKDLMLFAMIFGAGILMIADRCAAAGRDPFPLHVQRMGALMLIGLLHAYLVWPGDILFTYSVCGLIVFACRQWSPRRVLALGSVLYLVPLALLIAAQVIVPRLKPEFRDAVWATFQPGTETIARYLEVYRGGWWAQMSERVPGALTQHTFLLALAMGWVSAAMMLYGMALYRLGFLAGGADRRAFWRLLAWSGPLGVALTAGGMWLNFDRGWSADFSFFIGRLPGELGAPFLALAVLGGATLLFTRRRRPPRHDSAPSRGLKPAALDGANDDQRAGALGRALAAVGRMSLTNYLMHSVILTFLFYGTGLGWIGQVDRVWQTFIVVAIWALQLAVSPLWLARFQFGPAEWLWRTISYMRRQPFHRSV